MSLPPPNDKIKTDRVQSFASLADFDRALFDAITRSDISTINYLLHGLTGSDEGARRIAREE